MALRFCFDCVMKHLTLAISIRSSLPDLTQTPHPGVADKILHVELRPSGGKHLVKDLQQLCTCMLLSKYTCYIVSLVCEVRST